MREQRRELEALGEWRGGSTPSKSVSAYWNGGTMPWVSPKDMTGPAIVGSEDMLTKLGSARLTIFAPGDVATVVRSGILKHSFPVARGLCEFTVNQDLKVLHPADDVDGGYAFHLLRSLGHRVVTTAVKSGTTVESLDPSVFFKLAVYVPDLPQQRTIAKFLDVLDDAIRKTEQIIAKLKHVKQGLLRDLLTRGIDDNGELRDPARHPDQFKHSPVGIIPKTWHLVDTASLCSVITKGTTPISGAMWQGNDGVRFLRVDNLSPDGTLDLLASQFRISPGTHSGALSRSRCLPGDVLMNIVGPPLGKLGLVPSSLGEANINQAVAVFRPKPSLVSKFLLLWLGYRETQQWFHRHAKQTSGQLNLTLAMCQQLPIPRIDETEQKALLSHWGALQERLETETCCAAKLRLLKQGMMDDLLTGRVRVKVPKAARG